MKATLENKLIIALILFVVFFVSLFIFSLVQSELRAITISNSAQAKLAICVLKNSVEQGLAQSLRKKPPQTLLKEALDSLNRPDLIKDVFIYSKENIAEASTASLAIGKGASSANAFRIYQVLNSQFSKTPNNAYVNKKSRVLTLYTPILSDNEVLYILQLDSFLGGAKEALNSAIMAIVLTPAVIILFSLFFGILLFKKLIKPITMLNAAAKEVVSGDLNMKIHIATGDELEELADNFNSLTAKLKNSRAGTEGASLLTGLPGAAYVQKEAEARIKTNRKFSIIYCDIDNLKMFNDKYGIEKGNEAIKIVSSVLKGAIAQEGGPDNFIAHESGDNFMVFTTPDKAQAIAKNIMSQFDSRIKILYSQEDLERGYIAITSRHGGKIKKTPIMTISLAGISNEIRPIYSYGEAANIAKEVQGKAKEVQGSCFVMDQRKIPWPPNMPRPS